LAPVIERSANEARAEEALTDLRTYLLRAALFTLQRSLHYVGHLESSILGELAEDWAQGALTAILQRLHVFRGESQFTTRAYAFAVNTALVAARRERRASVPLDRILEGTDSPPWPARDEAGLPDPERHAMQTEMMAAIRDGIEQQLTLKQQQVLRALVFEEISLEEVVRHRGSNRNAVYKLVHDAVGLALAVLATVGCTSTMAQQTAPPSNYKKVSTLVALPDFVPGLGTLYGIPQRCPRAHSLPTTSRARS
jgi:RNA polymerase sigma-70 factor, ECF subfamily